MFFKKKDKEKEIDDLIKVAALLIHAANIDQNFSEEEKNIIRQTLLKIGANEENIEEIIINAQKIEEDSNQILDFTKEVKNMNEDSKIKIIEVLWKIVYSDNNPDMYENSLMRRLSGLLYLDPKIVGDTKKRVINNLKK